MASETLDAILRRLQQQKAQIPLDGPVMGAPVSPSDGMLGGPRHPDQPPMSLGDVGGLVGDTLADAVQGVTGWRPGTTPEWTPQWLRDLSASNTAAEQAGQQAAATNVAPGIPAAVGPDRLGYLLGFAGPVEAYHGSPHSFEAFDSSKIGTGEAAQAYGHGLYFAENEGVVNAYKNQLGAGKIEVGNRSYMPAELSEQIFKESGRSEPEFQRGVMDATHQLTATGKPPTAPNDLSSWVGYGPMAQREGYAFAANKLGAAKASAGSMYQVRINAEPEQFLHWDKPLSEQSPHVQEGVRRVLPDVTPEITGQDIHDVLVKQGAREDIDIPGHPKGWGIVQRGDEGQPAASRVLSEAGIPGIRYLDQGSRQIPTLEDVARDRAVFQTQIDRNLAEVKAGTLDAETAGRLNKDLQHQIDQPADTGRPTHNYVALATSL
jgi:hypothetical protein